MKHTKKKIIKQVTTLHDHCTLQSHLNLFQLFRNLQTLNIAATHICTKEELKCLANNCRTLKHLRLTPNDVNSFVQVLQNNQLFLEFLAIDMSFLHPMEILFNNIANLSLSMLILEQAPLLTQDINMIAGNNHSNLRKNLKYLYFE